MSDINEDASTPPPGFTPPPRASRGGSGSPRFAKALAKLVKFFAR
jgi:hypothetical protein